MCSVSAKCSLSERTEEEAEGGVEEEVVGGARVREYHPSHFSCLVVAYLLSIRITPLAMRLRQLDHQVLMFVHSRNSSFVCEP